MAKIYYNLIIKKQRTLSQVPLSLRNEVLRLLKHNGYDENGNKIRKQG